MKFCTAQVAYNRKSIAISEPHTGFHIAFKMLDIDGNEHVDQKEFLKVRFILSLNGGFNMFGFIFNLFAFSV